MESEFGKHREPRLKNLKSVDEKKKSKPSADRIPGSFAMTQTEPRRIINPRRVYPPAFARPFLFPATISTNVVIRWRGQTPSVFLVCRGARMESAENAKANSSRLNSVLTDIHFWVPVAVLVAGLLLLSFMR